MHLQAPLAFTKRACERGAFALVAFGFLCCLPDLDHSLLTNHCKGNQPNGFLDPGEECDDGNRATGDGCSQGCTVECVPPSVKDPLTNHCYTVLPNTLSYDAARAQCQQQFAHLVTVRSDAEANFLRNHLLAGQQGPWRTAYVLSKQPTSSGREVLQALPLVPHGLESTVPQEPGVLARITAKNGLLLEDGSVCTGCFTRGLARSGTWWTQTAAQLVLDQNGAFSVAPEGVRAAICERAPPGTPLKLCPTDANCVQGATLQFQIENARYAYFLDLTHRLPWSTAEQACRRLGSNAHLWVIESETEREQVVRLLTSAGNLIDGSLWLGLSVNSNDGQWKWADGRSTQARPMDSPKGLSPPWAEDPSGFLGLDLACAEMRLEKQPYYWFGLVQPLPQTLCEGKAQGGISPPHAYLCKMSLL